MARRKLNSTFEIIDKDSLLHVSSDMSQTLSEQNSLHFSQEGQLPLLGNSTLYTKVSKDDASGVNKYKADAEGITGRMYNKKSIKKVKYR